MWSGQIKLKPPLNTQMMSLQLTYRRTWPLYSDYGAIITN